MLRVLRSTARAAVDVVFPITCIGCGTDDTWFCDACRQTIQPIVPSCIGCGARTLHGLTCGACQHTRRVRGVVAVGRYADPLLRTAVHALKFQGVRTIAAPLGAMLARALGPALGTTAEEYTLVPIPLARRRERARGFNQSMLLAEAVHDCLSLPLFPLLARKKSAPPQTSVDAHLPELRQQNIAGMFSLAEDMHTVPEKCVLLDDVATTGATLEEAAGVLYHHGAREAWGAVICRG